MKHLGSRQRELLAECLLHETYGQGATLVAPCDRGSVARLVWRGLMLEAGSGNAVWLTDAGFAVATALDGRCAA